MSNYRRKRILIPLEDILFSAGGGFLFGAIAGYAIKKVIKIAALVLDDDDDNLELGFQSHLGSNSAVRVEYLEQNSYGPLMLSTR
jgi:hypothetical protein